MTTAQWATNDNDHALEEWWLVAFSSKLMDIFSQRENYPRNTAVGLGLKSVRAHRGALTQVVQGRNSFRLCNHVKEILRNKGWSGFGGLCVCLYYIIHWVNSPNLDLFVVAMLIWGKRSHNKTSWWCIPGCNRAEPHPSHVESVLACSNNISLTDELNYELN